MCTEKKGQHWFKHHCVFCWFVLKLLCRESSESELLKLCSEVSTTSPRGVGRRRFRGSATGTSLRLRGLAARELPRQGGAGAAASGWLPDALPSHVNSGDVPFCLFVVVPSSVKRDQEEDGAFCEGPDEMLLEVTPLSSPWIPSVQTSAPALHPPLPFPSRATPRLEGG